MFSLNKHSLRIGIALLAILVLSSLSFSQTNYYPAVKANFGIRAGQLSGADSVGMDDWGQGASGNGVILSNGSPDLVNFPNAAHVKDRVVGKGEASAFTNTVKASANPNTWTLGSSNVGGKTDLINVYAHARRDASDSLWYFIAAERLTTNGATTVDFEFFKAGLTVNANGTITATGPDSGRTAGIVTTPVINGGGTVSKPGDMLVVTEYGGSSITTEVYLWTKNPPVGVTFDSGNGTGSFGWAKINPPAGSIVAAQNNSSISGGAWGTFQGSNADSTNTLDALAFVEVGLNMTKLGLDVDTLTCSNIGQAVVHSRTSPSFSSNLADFAGPLSFSLNTCVTLTLQKYVDTDGLLATTNDRTLKNWNLSVYKNSVSPSNLVATIASGNTLGSLDTLKKGTYIVTEADSASWSHLGILETSDVNGNVTHTSTNNSYTFVGGRGDSLVLKFINAQSASLSGQKFKDANNNGTKDIGETGLSGWTIQLQNTSGTVLNTATTNGTGNYSFSDLTPGTTYRVREVQQEGWTQTTANPSDVTPTSGQQITGVNFGNARLTTTSVTTSPNPSQRFQSVTITATVSPNTATGTVQFFDGVTSLGTGSVSSGTATINISTLAGGDRSITAVYSGDAQFNSSTSAIHIHTVIRTATSVALNSSQNPSTFGQSVSFTADVTPGTATGQIEFFIDNSSFGTVSIASGSAVITTSDLSAGSHPVRARYLGDEDNDTSSSSTLNQVVNQRATTTSISAPTITYNANGSVTVTVSSSVGTPSGNVSLSVDGGSATTQALVGGSATFTITAPTAGDHSLSATYTAQGNYAGSSGTGNLHVNQASTTTSVNAPTVTFNSNGSATVTVTSAAGVVTGDVTLSVDGGAGTTQTLSGGSTTFTITNPSAGTHSLNVTYAAQGNFAASSTTGSLQVNRAGTSTSINAPTVTYNSNGSATVTVTSTAGTVTGNVSLSVDGGAASTQALSGGSSTFTIVTPNAGDHSLTVTYLAQGNFDSSSSTVNFHVNRASTSLSVNAPTITYGSNGSVTLTVSSSAGTPTGNVSLSVDGGSAQTQALSGGSTTFTVNTPTAGNHTLSASYSAQGNFDASAAFDTLRVNKASTTTAVGSSLNPSILGQSVTFTATLSPSSATGTVEFFDGVTSLGTASLSGGTASVSTSSLTAGTHSITSVYSGDANYLGSTSSALSQSVLNPVPTTTSINPSIQPIASGQFTLTIVGSNFIPTSVARFEGNDRATTFISSTELQATILASDILLLGEYQITVFNPAPGGGTSNAQTLSVVGARISGLKFNDLDGDGTKDGNETGLSGWQIVISGPINDTTTTDSNGDYSFNLELPGTYTVTEIQQAGWQQTSSSPAPIVIAIGENVTGVNFGNFKPPVISGYKFEDANGNGMFDETESGLAGWTINAVKGLQNKTTVTGVDGSYSFTFSTSETGTWILTEVMQAGWLQSFPADGDHSILTVSALDTVNVNFGNYHPISLSGKKYEDMNGDSLTVGDPTLNGWVIELYKDESLVASTTTSGNGDFEFDSLSPGVYVVQEVLQNGWIQTLPASGTYSITLTSGSNQTGIDFANFRLGSISGMKFLDYNGDSLKDISEGGLENWEIILSIDNSPIDTATTDGTGAYSFTGLSAGTYTVEEIVQPGWYQTTPAGGEFEITINSGTSATEKNFGNFEFGSVSGTMFFDRDSSGTQNISCEGMLPNIKMVLVGTHTQPDTVTTDDNGSFTFTNVPADVYSLTQVNDPLWRQTFQPNGSPYAITMVSGLDTAYFEFGNFYMLDTLKFRTFSLKDYNSARRAPQKSGFIKKPTAGNVRDSVMIRRGFGLENPSDSGYLRIGIRRPDSALHYGWFFHRWTVYKGPAVQKWIYNTHAWGTKRDPKTKLQVARKPAFYLGILGEQITETYFGNAGNHLTLELTTLKTNIAASDLKITPSGLGDLLYVCRDTSADSVFVGKSIRQITALADTALTMGRFIRGVGDTVYRYPVSYLNLLDTVVSRINREFRGTTIDTISTKPLKVRGVKGLYKVPYLMRDSIAPVPLAHFEPNYTSEESPVEFKLEQNYPNPFNPVTTIQFELKVPSNVTLKVYNLLGQEVVTLLNESEFEDGVQTIEIDATNFASGVYFYKLEANGLDENGVKHSFQSVKKMTLLK